MGAYQLVRGSMAEDTNTARGRLSTAAWVAVLLLASALVVGGPALWIWPESSARVVSAVFGWVPRAPISAEDVRDLGNQLTGGTVVAFAVVLLERLAEGRFRRAEATRADEREEEERRRREEEEERNFRLLIGLQKDLTGIDLKGHDLKSYFLRAKLLTDATLKNADLAGADLTRCGLVNANLSGATLTGTALIDAQMHGAVLIGAVANAARMQETLLNDAVLDNVDLRGAHLTGADLRRVVAGTRKYGEGRPPPCQAPRDPDRGRGFRRRRSRRRLPRGRLPRRGRPVWRD